ncbi:MAG: nitroreductase family protein [Betaproteobacteria bacterium]|nr:nitroreductase family protein [Betaproteobacteria bacterium]MCH9848515.1 nitroreductase family protein [Betaproteobacteria bacterium]
MQKPAITQAPIHDIIANRWSPRAYDANKALSQKQIISLLEAARWAPSCFGDEPWRFIVWDKNQDETAWDKAYDCIVPGNQTWAKDAPVLILICADTLFSHNQKPNRWANYDTGAAAVSLCLQATSMGLVTHQMGGFDGEKTRAAFGIPEQIEMMSMLAVGYAADADTLSDELKERELAPRKRRPLGELFYDGVWNQPII